MIIIKGRANATHENISQTPSPTSAAINPASDNNAISSGFPHKLVNGLFLIFVYYFFCEPAPLLIGGFSSRKPEVEARN